MADARKALENIARKKAEGKTSRAKIIPGKVHISFAMSGKLYRIAAISTAVHLNPICRARIAAGNSVCAHCYAVATLNQYAETCDHMEENFRILTTRLLTDEEIQMLVFEMRIEGFTELRIEAFGDTANSLQAENYIRICHAMNSAGICVGLWTKNPNHYAHAITKLGKPVKTTFILSSCGIDTPDINIANNYWFIDRIFTVYNDSIKALYSIAKGDIKCMCGKGACKITCRQCYSGYTRDINVPAANIVEDLR